MQRLRALGRPLDAGTPVETDSARTRQPKGAKHHEIDRELASPQHAARRRRGVRRRPASTCSPSPAWPPTCSACQRGATLPIVGLGLLAYAAYLVVGVAPRAALAHRSVGVRDRGSGVGRRQRGADRVRSAQLDRQLDRRRGRRGHARVRRAQDARHPPDPAGPAPPRAPSRSRAGVWERELVPEAPICERQAARGPP